MPEQFRFIPELVRIVNGALRLDVDKVRNYTAFLAKKLDEAGDPATAERLRKLLQETDTQLRPAEARFARSLPVDTDSRFPLVEQVKLQHLQEPALHLLQAQWDVVNEFVSVAKSHTTLGSADSGGALSFLMYGPPGTGKSRLARHIAAELGLDLYVARLDGLISSFLGSTAKNIRALFDFAAKTPCVLFLDEFDAIAKLRSDAQELGELKRVVNSFLQNLDTLGRQSIVLAATNHEALLDAAVWRRFTYRIALALPTMAQREQMWADFLSPVTFSPRALGALADLSEGLSGSDIHEASTRLKRRQIANGQALRLQDALPVLANLGLSGAGQGHLATVLASGDSTAIVQTLKQRDPKRYSLAMLAELLGLSKATAHRLSKHTTPNDQEEQPQHRAQGGIHG
jgi:ATPase family associated with various cellular activities (AAA)